jgi:hypothetical protein
VDRGRRIGVHYAVAIATDGTGACDLHHVPEPVRVTGSSASAAVPVTVASAAKRDLPYLRDLGSVRAFFILGIGRQVDGKPIVPSWLSEGERAVVNGQYTLRLDRSMMANEPPASAVAKRSRSS